MNAPDDVVERADALMRRRRFVAIPGALAEPRPMAAPPAPLEEDLPVLTEVIAEDDLPVLTEVVSMVTSTEPVLAARSRVTVPEALSKRDICCE